MHIHILHINPLIPRREIQCRFTCKSYKNNISIHSSREGRYDSISIFVLKNQYISIHSSHKGRYFKFIKGGIYPKHFNSLIPQREIQQYCTKNLSLHFCSITKNHLLSLFIASEILKIQELTTKTILIPVRIPYSFHVSFRFAPEWHLLSIATYYNHITSPLPFSRHLLYQNGSNLIILHVKSIIICIF